MNTHLALGANIWCDKSTDICLYEVFTIELYSSHFDICLSTLLPEFLLYLAVWARRAMSHPNFFFNNLPVNTPFY